MRRRLPGIDVALGLAADRVRLLAEEVPEPHRPDVAGERWRILDAQVDRACGNGDASSALLAIEQWEQHVSCVLSRLLPSLPEAADR